MRIGEIRKEWLGDRARIEGAVVWEDCGREPVRLYYEMPAPFGAALEPRAEAFLLAGVIPAMDQGERRVRLEGTLCPELRDNVSAALRVLHAWHGTRPPAIEATQGFRVAAPPAAPRVAATMSGGIDSLATLRANRLAVPRDHPASIRDAFAIFGMNTYDHDERGAVPARLRDFEERLARWRPLAAQEGLELIPVYTNMRALPPSFEAWRGHTLGAGLASVAHAFGARVTKLLIPSPGYPGIPNVAGQHPMLDDNFCSATLQVFHHGLWMSRLEKTRLVAEWEAGMAILQPCQQIELGSPTPNCGHCNKCWRTMLTLFALGRLEAAHTFPPCQIDAGSIGALKIDTDHEVSFLEEIAEALRPRGGGLAKALEARLARYRRKRSAAVRAAAAAARRSSLLRRAFGRGPRSRA